LVVVVVLHLTRAHLQQVLQQVVPVAQVINLQVVMVLEVEPIQ
jgi:hypothetical protein